GVGVAPQKVRDLGTKFGAGPRGPCVLASHELTPTDDTAPARWASRATRSGPVSASPFCGCLRPGRLELAREHRRRRAPRWRRRAARARGDLGASVAHSLLLVAAYRAATAK